eukprot:6186453-Pleurochrysis_carterae.AAC.1
MTSAPLRKPSTSIKTYQTENRTEWVSGKISESRDLRAEIPRSPRQRDGNQRRILLRIYSGTRRAIAK